MSSVTDVLAIEHIVKTPGVCGGKPRITGTRIRVQDIAIWHMAGRSVGDMTTDFGLTPGQVHAALSYYHDHREEIDRAIAEAEALADTAGTPSSEFRAQIEARLRAMKGDTSSSQDQR